MGWELGSGICHGNQGSWLCLVNTTTAWSSGLVLPTAENNSEWVFPWESVGYMLVTKKKKKKKNRNKARPCHWRTAALWLRALRLSYVTQGEIGRVKEID